MKQYLIFLLIGFAILTQSNSCKKSKPIIAEPVYNSEFPNNIGTFWKYKVYDSVSANLDTVTIKVIGTTNLDNGDPVSIWEITSLYNPTILNYVSNKIDGIRIYVNKLSSASPFKKYIFPLSVGSKWITYNILDTNKVTLNTQIAVIAGTFSNAFRINRDVIIPPGYNPIKEDEWFVQNIGMVSRYYFEIGPGYVIKNKWELLSYLIK